MRNFIVVLLIGCIECSLPARAESFELGDLDIEQLMDMELSSAARKVQSLQQTAAAAFIITRENIRRSGADSLPEALRLAPGIEVAGISASKWAVSARGFNGRFANKLLVLIDGRNIYTPAFSGVYWAAQDIPLEDIERIEVIRGPGATMWGANAVNAVINIITRHAADTTRGVVTAHGGSRGHSLGLHYGAEAGEDVHSRVYAKHSRGKNFVDDDGKNLADDWERRQAGFRVDWKTDKSNEWTVQSDIANLEQGQVYDLPDALNPPYIDRQADRADIRNAHLLGRWQRTLSSSSELRLQSYMDYSRRDEITHHERRISWDIDFQHRFSPAAQHDFIWGTGYRVTEDDMTSPAYIALEPQSRHDQTFSGFVQDEIELLDDELWVTLGGKFEHNDYSGFEIQPNLRALWLMRPGHSVWGAISRAVRTPSRALHDVRITRFVMPPLSPQNPAPLPVAVTLVGNEAVASEKVLAYELGYRVQPRTNLGLDIAAFYNRYQDIITARPEPPILVGTYLDLPVSTNSDIEGETYGLELVLDWYPREHWHIQAVYNALEIDMRQVGMYDPSGPEKLIEGSSPRRQFSLRLGLKPHDELELDLWWRMVSELPEVGGFAALEDRAVDAYTSLDARVGWHPVEDLEVALTGKNILDSRHREYIEELYPVHAQVPRSVFLSARWSF